MTSVAAVASSAKGDGRGPTRAPVPALGTWRRTGAHSWICGWGWGVFYRPDVSFMELFGPFTFKGADRVGCTDAVLLSFSVNMSVFFCSLFKWIKMNIFQCSILV